MILTKEQLKELEEKARPLMQWLADNFHPHVKVEVDSTSAEFLEGSATIGTEDFIN